MRADFHEWNSLADDRRYADVVQEHRQWLPPVSAKPAPGSLHRILV